MTGPVPPSRTVTLHIALDDTDMPGTRGTGRLARAVADAISARHPVAGVTRHQLLVDPAIPYTSHNSCAVVHVGAGRGDLGSVLEVAREVMRDEFIPGSDPGLAGAVSGEVSPAVIAFGQDAKRCVLTQDRALRTARNAGVFLEPLGGTGDGVIGALAGIGLAATGCDGRYLALGRVRDLVGDCTVEAVLEAGVDQVLTLEGRPIRSGRIAGLDRRAPKPCPFQGRAVLFVEEADGVFIPVKRD